MGTGTGLMIKSIGVAELSRFFESYITEVPNFCSNRITFMGNACVDGAASSTMMIQPERMVKLVDVRRTNTRRNTDTTTGRLFIYFFK